MADSDLEKQLCTIESRFFSRQEKNEPLQTRLDRIELMVYGSTQQGSVVERLKKLQTVLSDADAQTPARLNGRIEQTSSGIAKLPAGISLREIKPSPADLGSGG